MENEKCLGCKNYDTEWPCVMGVKCYSFYPDDYRKKDYFEPKEDGKKEEKNEKGC